MTGALSPTHWLIIAVVLVLLLGAKRLPDTARGLGKAMRIFKAETAALSDGDRPATENQDGDKQAHTGNPGSQATERAMTVPSSTSSETAA